MVTNTSYHHICAHRCKVVTRAKRMKASSTEAHLRETWAAWPAPASPGTPGTPGTPASPGTQRTPGTHGTPGTRGIPIWAQKTRGTRRSDWRTLGRTARARETVGSLARVPEIVLNREQAFIGILCRLHFQFQQIPFTSLTCLPCGSSGQSWSVRSLYFRWSWICRDLTRRGQGQRDCC